MRQLSVWKRSRKQLARAFPDALVGARVTIDECGVRADALIALFGLVQERKKLAQQAFGLALASHGPTPMVL